MCRVLLQGELEGYLILGVGAASEVAVPREGSRWHGWCPGRGEGGRRRRKGRGEGGGGGGKEGGGRGRRRKGRGEGGEGGKEGETDTQEGEINDG